MARKIPQFTFTSMRVLLIGLSIISLLVGCTASRQTNLSNLKAIRFVGQYSLPHKMQFKGTTIGGLSGIDYSAKEKAYYLISDDRSDINPVRFYKVKISVSESGIKDVRFRSVHYLLDKADQPYPSRKLRPVGIPDPEGIRLDPNEKFIAWCSEGERVVRKDCTVIVHPTVFLSNKEGRWIDSLPIPDKLRMQTFPQGPRNNGVFEGLSFSLNGNKLFVGVEEPLYDDGPRAGLFDSTGWVRILQYDMWTRKPAAQFAYQIDPVVQEPISQGLFVVNGITDVLTINDHQLLVTERSFSTGRLGNNIRIYLVDLNGADDVSNIAALHKNPSVKPLTKKLLLNMDRLGILVDNIEGATFGPRLPNGKQSLIFVADDNFSDQQQTQFLLFEIE